MSVEVIKNLAEAFPGVSLINSYGLTEAGGTITVLPPENAEKKPGSVGLPGPGVDIKLLGANGSFLAHGVGEVVVRTQAMKGYVNADASTRFHEGYLKTGDLGEFDNDGCLFLKGRVDDMMIINGINVYPLEVEQLLRQSDLVVDCAVASGNGILGEYIVAYLVVDKAVDDASRRLKEFIKKNIPRHKQPSECVFLDVIPYSKAGKLLRQKLQLENA